MQCPDCGYKKEKRFPDLLNNGFACPKCSDSTPYPEKFLFEFLEQLLNNKFYTQLSKKIFNWCSSFRYDNYIPDSNCIIETHGIQHYEKISGNWKFKNSLEEIQNNDFDKEWLARINNINNYIIIDCRKSEMEWIKNSIMNSKLPQLLNFKEDDIDWLKCHEHACKSLVKITCDMWKDMKSILQIADELKLHKCTIRKYLKQGVELGWCDYDSKYLT